MQTCVLCRQRPTCLWQIFHTFFLYAFFPLGSCLEFHKHVPEKTETNSASDVRPAGVVQERGEVILSAPAPSSSKTPANEDETTAVRRILVVLDEDDDENAANSSRRKERTDRRSEVLSYEVRAPPIGEQEQDDVSSVQELKLRSLAADLETAHSLRVVGSQYLKHVKIHILHYMFENGRHIMQDVDLLRGEAGKDRTGPLEQGKSGKDRPTGTRHSIPGGSGTNEEDQLHARLLHQREEEFLASLRKAPGVRLAERDVQVDLSSSLSTTEDVVAPATTSSVVEREEEKSRKNGDRDTSATSIFAGARAADVEKTRRSSSPSTAAVLNNDEELPEDRRGGSTRRSLASSNPLRSLASSLGSDLSTGGLLVADSFSEWSQSWKRFAARAEERRLNLALEDAWDLWQRENEEALIVRGEQTDVLVGDHNSIMGGFVRFLI